VSACGELPVTVWRLDRVTSWSRDELTGSPFYAAVHSRLSVHWFKFSVNNFSEFFQGHNDPLTTPYCSRCKPPSISKVGISVNDVRSQDKSSQLLSLDKTRHRRVQLVQVHWNLKHDPDFCHTSCTVYTCLASLLTSVDAP